MSGIAAILHVDGAPADRDELGRIVSAIAYRGPDGTETWTNGQVALGHCMLRTTAESLEEQQPLANDDESLVLVMDGYLTNWEELRSELVDLGARLRTRSDAELVLRAYEVWGDDCPRHLDGEFAFLVWDAGKRELFCVRDHQGLRPLFYHWNGRRLLVASDVAGIFAALREKPSLNHGYLAEMMAEQWYSRTETIWSGIMRLSPAHFMKISAKGITQEVYWTLPLEVSINYAQEEDYIDHYRELLTDCVRRSSRSFGPLGFEVSGGLDSSSLFCVADKLFKEGKLLAPDISGYTLSGPTGTDADEIAFARAVGQHTGRKIGEVPLFMPGLKQILGRPRSIATTRAIPMALCHSGLSEPPMQTVVGCSSTASAVTNGLTEYRAIMRTCLAARELSELTKSLRADRTHLGWRTTGWALAKALVKQAMPEGIRYFLRELLAPSTAPPYWLSDWSRGELARRRLDHERQLRSEGRWHYKEAKLYFAFNLHALDLMSRQRARSALEGRHPMLMRAFIEFSAATPERLRAQRRRDQIHSPKGDGWHNAQVDPGEKEQG